jgi:chemotaxis protein methyltransferase CheR
LASASTFESFPGVSAGIYTQADFDAMRAIIHETAGIVLSPSKAMLVYSRIAPLVRKTGSATFAAYIARIRTDEAERRVAVCALTTNHTFFFREIHHFEHLEEHVRPTLLSRMKNEPVRIWSAGCSSGEETWSIAMTLLGEEKAVGKRILKQDVAILATDLADHALATARAGQYAMNSIDAIPDALRRQWLAERNGQACMDAEMMGMVSFRRLNLLGDWPMKRQFDVIFCRNVMIYFDEPTKQRLVSRFCDQLAPGGYLYIGHSERIGGPATARLTCEGSTIYRRTA